MSELSKRVEAALEQHAPVGFDPASDDMTVQFAVKLAENDTEIERLRAALKLARAALTAITIGTVHMDDPDWYRQVDQAVAGIDAALGDEQVLSK